MIRLAASCVWVVVVALGAAYAGATWRFEADPAKAGASKEHLQQKKTAPISVPMIADGAVAGYIVAQFIYLVDPERLKEMPGSPDAFITDEAFRKLYVDKVDFAHLEKYDVKALVESLKTQVNQRLGADLIKDVLIEQFNYVAKKDISR